MIREGVSGTCQKDWYALAIGLVTSTRPEFGRSIESYSFLDGYIYIVFVMEAFLI